ncbi:hypothetical protein NTH_01003 [Nitratireductor thuwali]|uniref:Uncharacterized protein n=1 Tax=Nitratireductor thuwali TaxID=2267699 RepID=A0ABY5MKY9_9HYPH|nr:hypothetical protein NTH_01003 [Nitratireductor thuwali]
MDVDCLEPTGTEVLKSMRYAFRTEHNVASFRIYHLVSHEEARVPLYDDENLIIGVNMQPWPFARRVIAVCQDRV